jgi:hypothetical protein
VIGFFYLKQASNPRLQPKSPSRRNSAPRAKPTAPRASLRTTASVGAFIIAGEPLEDCPQCELPIGEERPVASPIGAISPHALPGKDPCKRHSVFPHKNPAATPHSPARRAPARSLWCHCERKNAPPLLCFGAGITFRSSLNRDRHHLANDED